LRSRGAGQVKTALMNVTVQPRITEVPTVKTTTTTLPTGSRVSTTLTTVTKTNNISSTETNTKDKNDDPKTTLTEEAKYQVVSDIPPQPVHLHHADTSKTLSPSQSSLILIGFSILTVALLALTTGVFVVFYFR
jgi:hypothetical protein